MSLITSDKRIKKEDGPLPSLRNLKNCQSLKTLQDDERTNVFLRKEKKPKRNTKIENNLSCIHKIPSVKSLNDEFLNIGNSIIHLPKSISQKKNQNPLYYGQDIDSKSRRQLKLIDSKPLLHLFQNDQIGRKIFRLAKPVQFKDLLQVSQVPLNQKDIHKKMSPSSDSSNDELIKLESQLRKVHVEKDPIQKQKTSKNKKTKKRRYSISFKEIKDEKNQNCPEPSSLIQIDLVQKPIYRWEFQKETNTVIELNNKLKQNCQSECNDWKQSFQDGEYFEEMDLEHLSQYVKQNLKKKKMNR